MVSWNSFASRDEKKFPYLLRLSYEKKYLQRLNLYHVQSLLHNAKPCVDDDVCMFVETERMESKYTELPEKI